MIKIKKKLIEEECKKRILNSNVFKNIELIGICGSIGRKEKNIEEKNLNDVDFFVVATEVNWKEKIKLEKNLNEYLNTKYTDISFIKLKNYLKIINSRNISQFYYDMIYGTTILYNRLTILIPYKERTVDMLSLYIVYLTRLWCLIGPYNFLDEKIICRNKSFAEYQLKKAISALIDGVLINEKKYKSPFRRIKINNIKETEYYRKNKLFKEIIEKYEKDKIKLTLETYKKVIMIYKNFGNEIFIYQNIYFILFKTYSIYFFKNIKNIRKQQMLYKQLKIIIKNINRYKVIKFSTDYK